MIKKMTVNYIWDDSVLWPTRKMFAKNGIMAISKQEGATPSLVDYDLQSDDDLAYKDITVIFAINDTPVMEVPKIESKGKTVKQVFAEKTAMRDQTGKFRKQNE